MAPKIRIDTRDPRPIWRQIEEGVTQLVASGALGRGAAIPSVRDLAQSLRINPATVVKAYQRLADQGILITRRGEGTFVADDPPAMRAAERRARLAEAAIRLASVAETLGVEHQEAHGALDEALRALQRGDKEKR